MGSLKRSLWGIGCVFLVACSGAPEEDGADYEIASGPPAASPVTESSEEPATDSSEPPEATETQEQTTGNEIEKPKPYAGSLSAAPKAPFGGSPFCRYEMTIKDIAVEIGVLGSGDVVSGSVTDTAVESTIQCPHQPMAPAAQVFAFKKATKTTDGWRVEFAGDAKNRPKTSLVATLVSAGDGYDATFTWKRTDQKAPLLWTVKGKVPLKAK